jgi:hypothetical protein
MPLWIDAERRFSRQIVLGVYGGVEVVFPEIGTAYGFIFGGEGQYYLAQPILGFEPWLGAQVGYEVINFNLEGVTVSSSGLRGGVQAGLDYRKGFGPFAAFDLGSFASGESHEWLTIGMRGTYDW